MIKKTYHISGFDCPNCAHKSEAHLGKHEKVDSCHIDFSTNKMYITYKEEELEVEEIKKVIAQVESDPLDIYDLDKKVVKKTYHISGFDCPNCAKKSEALYGIAFRKGSDASQKVSDAIVKLYNDGKLQEIAKKYNLEEQIPKIKTSE